MRLFIFEDVKIKGIGTLIHLVDNDNDNDNVASRFSMFLELTSLNNVKLSSPTDLAA